MELSKEEVRASYDSGAKYYDYVVWLYRLLGLRIAAYRRRALELLRLKAGDVVVELGCGTGLNFPLIIELVGPEGRLVGVDLSPEMLAQARERVRRAGWQNVELVHADIAGYVFPEGVNAVFSVGVFGYVEQYDRVVKAASDALAPGGRLVIVDGKEPERLPSWLFRLVLWLARPFGVTRDYFSRRTWESVERHLRNVSVEQMYGGMIYIAAGTAPERNGW